MPGNNMSSQLPPVHKIHLRPTVWVMTLIVLAFAAGYLVWAKANQAWPFDNEIVGLPTHQNAETDERLAPVWQSFQSEGLGFSLNFPNNLTPSRSTDGVSFTHFVPFKNSGECDMKGDSQTYDTLKDFGANFQLFSTNLTATVKQLSPYIPEENFKGNTLKANPGFIDQYQIGSLKGFSIYEGVEGCGHIIYYFPLNNNTKTFVATHDMVQILSGAISASLKDQLLKVPGVIDNEASKTIFEGILKSVKLTSTK